MKSIAYPYQTPQERGTLKCFLLALFMHVLLGMLLYYAVHWQSRTPAGVEAELWDTIPDVAPPVIQSEPEKPQPVIKPEPEENADIALQTQKRRQAAAAAAAAAAEAARQAEQRERKAREAERQAAAQQQRQSELARLQAMANNAAPATGGAGGRSGTGAGAGGTASPGYADKVRRRVLPNIIFTEEVAGNPTAVVSVRMAPDGSLLSVRLAKSSGNAGWDNAVLRAVERSDPLPRDENGMAPSNINIYFQPRD